MLLWQLIRRDADVLLRSPEDAREWFGQYADRLWVEPDSPEAKLKPESVWNGERWEECCRCVRAVGMLAEMKEKPELLQQWPAGFLLSEGAHKQYIARHVRRELIPLPQSGDPLGVCSGPLGFVTSIVQWPDGEPGTIVLVEECPGMWWAYVFTSMFDPSVIPAAGGGRCERCGKAMGMTRGGTKPKTGNCDACRQQIRRQKDPENARKKNAKHNRDYRERKTTQKQQAGKQTDTDHKGD